MRYLRVVVLLVALCFLLVQLEWIAVGAAGGMGVNYRTSGSSESAEDWLQLLRSRGIGKIRLHDADAAMLRAAGGGREAAIEVIVGVRDDEIPDLAVSPASAQSWIARNVVPYFPTTKITAIAVGNEVLSSAKADHDSIAPFLVPAMRNLFAALAEVGLENLIKVSAPQSAGVLSSRFPPSSAAFSGANSDRIMDPLLEFLESSGSYFMLNLYPIDFQRDGVGPQVEQPTEGLSASEEVKDPLTGRHYSSMLEALKDAVSVAMASLGRHQPSVVGIEMEWSPTSASSSLSNAVLVDSTQKVSAVDIAPKFGEDSVINRPPEIEKVRVEAFSSRRFLPNVLQGNPQRNDKRRRLANKSWCVAKSDASTTALQTALDWACGPAGGANCQPLQVGQSCFLPNTVVAHASYAFNSYYQKLSWASGSCDFGGIAQTTTSDPSTASCLYSSSTSANGTPSTPTGTTIPSVASRLSWDRWCLMLTSCILVVLLKRTLPELKI